MTGECRDERVRIIYSYMNEYTRRPELHTQHSDDERRGAGAGRVARVARVGAAVVECECGDAQGGCRSAARSGGGGGFGGGSGSGNAPGERGIRVAGTCERRRAHAVLLIELQLNPINYCYYIDTGIIPHRIFMTVLKLNQCTTIFLN